jgi:hypothetical protein
VGREARPRVEVLGGPPPDCLLENVPHHEAGPVDRAEVFDGAHHLEQHTTVIHVDVGHGSMPAS